MTTGKKSIPLSLLGLGANLGDQKSWQQTVTIPQAIGTEDLSIPIGSKISLGCQAISLTEGVSLSITGSTVAVGSCVRCLAPVEKSVEISGSRVYYYPDDFAKLTVEVEELEVDDDNLDESYQLDGTSELDLYPMLVDLIVPEFPYRVLCSDQCQGLCSECGERWEELPENHSHEAVDPRWNALADLLKDGLSQGNAGGSN